MLKEKNTRPGHEEHRHLQQSCRAGETTQLVDENDYLHLQYNYNQIDTNLKNENDRINRVMSNEFSFNLSRILDKNGDEDEDKKKFLLKEILIETI